MQKGKFSYQLKNNDIITKVNGECFYKDEGVLSFIETDNTEISIDLKEKTFQRENNEMLLFLDFSLSKGKILVKELNNELDLQLKVNSHKMDDGKFSVNYTLSDQENFEFLIEWTLGGE